VSAAAVEFRGVSFRHADGTPVLDGLSLLIEPGEVVALLGRSGAGKSTILRLVNRMLLPTRGGVLVEGQDTREWDPIALRRRIGYVLQDGGLFPHMSVADNVGVVPRLEGWRPDDITPRVNALLEMVGLPPGRFASRWPEELSGGQRQRVGVARALAADPPVLLMDEPFGALDPITRAELQQETAHLQQRLRKTILLVTHDVDEALLLSDRVCIIDDGRLQACVAATAFDQADDPVIAALRNARLRAPRGASGGGSRATVRHAEGQSGDESSPAEPS
jgi:osmoprotectant transport system ATP-binding protein